MIQMKMKLSKASIVMMDEFVKTFPTRVQKRVFKRAGVKASEAMAEKVASLVPLQKEPKNKFGPFKHARYTVAFKVKEYRGGKSVFITGYRSKENQLATLLEKGNYNTSPRMTRHKTEYKKVHAGFRTQMVPQRRPNGKIRSVAEQVRRRDNKRSIGSVSLESQGPNRGAKGRFVRGGHGHSTGNFPKSKKPFAPITNAAKAMRNQIMDIMETEIAAGFKRAFAREAGNFGD